MSATQTPAGAWLVVTKETTGRDRAGFPETHLLCLLTPDGEIGVSGKGEHARRVLTEAAAQFNAAGVTFTVRPRIRTRAEVPRCISSKWK